MAKYLLSRIPRPYLPRLLVDNCKMAERLVERYAVGTAVEIWLGEQIWLPGVVIAHQPPAVWVRTEDGRAWFVTNGRRIRVNPNSTQRREDAEE